MEIKLLICLLYITYTDCIEWSNPDIVWVNRSGTVTLAWQYKLPQAYIIPGTVTLNIYCGFIVRYEALGGNMMNSLTFRNTDNGIMSFAAKNTVLGERVFIASFDDTRTIGLQIKNIQNDDPKLYGCEIMVINVPAFPWLRIPSPFTTVQIIDRPAFVPLNCLYNLPSLVSNQDLPITCKVTGNPRPNLYCQLFSYTGLVLDLLPQNSSLLEDIANLTFKAVPAEASLISCTAFRDISGSVVKRSRITVKHAPFAIRSFLINNFDGSLLLTWTKILENETGSDFINYQIEYSFTKLGVSKKKTIVVEDDEDSDTTEIQYSLTGLEGEQYYISVYGVNIYGKGPSITQVAYLGSANKLIGSQTDSVSSTYRHSIFCYWYIISSTAFYFLFFKKK